MKAKIIRIDGTVIELEGTVEEVERLVGAPPIQFVPYYVPQPHIEPAPVRPWESPYYVGLPDVVCDGGAMPGGVCGTFTLNAAPIS